MELDRSNSTPQTKFPVRINRKAPIPQFFFTDYFQGFEKVAAMKTLLGEQTEKILDKLKVEFIHSSFMRIAPGEDGHLLVGVPYLEKSDPVSIYLDVLLSLNMLQLVSRQIPAQEWSGDGTIESYRAMLKEARKMGISDSEVMEHFTGPRFLMSSDDYKKFLQKLGLGKPKKKSSKR